MKSQHKVSSAERALLVGVGWKRAPRFPGMPAGEQGRESLAELVDSGHPLFDVRIALEGALLGLFVSSMFLDIMYRKYVWLAFMLVALTRSFALEHARRERVVTAARVAEVVPEPASPPPLRPLGAGIDV